MSSLRPISIGFAGLVLLSVAAFGQTKPAAPPPVSSQPEVTTASFGAWTLRCQTRHEATVDTRICEIDQGIVPQGEQRPIAQIGIGRPSPKDELHVTAIVPNNITLPSSVKLTNGDKDPGVELTWRRCVPIGCLADAVLKDDVARAWRAETAENTGHLIFVAADGRTLNVQFTLRGFAQAMDAYSKEK